MVTEVVAATELVVTVKVALLAPAAMLTLAGTEAAVVLLLERVTSAPEGGAAALSVTVPWDVLPPITPVGFSVNELTAGAVVTESGAVSVTPA
jgi:hypothetical protein